MFAFIAFLEEVRRPHLAIQRVAAASFTKDKFAMVPTTP